MRYCGCSVPGCTRGAAGEQVLANPTSVAGIGPGNPLNLAD